jgi:predicted acyltransferase
MTLESTPPGSQTAMTNPALASTPVQRLLSLDVLRGITMAFMIMVNNNGGPGSWGFMHHAAWNGLTPADLVFPTFVFVVGASIVFAFDTRMARGASHAEMAWHTFRRAGILFLLGIVANGFPFFNLVHLRIYGVLQRIAFCYLLAGLFYLWDKRVWTKIAAIGALLVGYWVLLRWVPVPGAGMPARDIAFLDPDQNLVAWLDRQIFPYRLYEDFTTHNLRDSEGLLSNLPAVATVLIGLLAGLWLRSGRAAKTKTFGLVLGAVTCLGSGYLWSVWFPLNKKMWTSSYVLVAAGWSLAVLALVFWAVEQKDWRRGWTWPWLVFGSNSIVAYMFGGLFPAALRAAYSHAIGKPQGQPTHAVGNMFSGIPYPGLAAFAYSVSFTAVCFIPVWALYRKKIFVKV